MIRHTVHFTLVATDPDERAAALAGITDRLEALVGVVPGLHSLTISGDIGRLDDNADVILVSDHDDNAALEAYQVHPAHVEAAAYVRSVISGRSTVDFEV